MTEDQEAITNAASDFLFKCDRNGHILWHNHQFETCFNLPKQRHRDNFASFFPESEQKKLHEALHQAFKTGTSQIELSLVSKKEKEIITLSLNTLFTDLYSSFVGTGHKITEKKLAEQRIRLTSAVFENAHDGIIITDPQGQIIEANQRYLELLGLTKEQLIGINSRDDNPIQQQAIFDTNVWNTLRETGHWAGDIHHKAMSGEEVFLHTRITAVMDQQGEIQNYIALVSDTTELTSSRNALRESEAHFHQIVSNYPQPIIVLDKEHRVIQWNKACEQFIGLTEKEMIGTRDQWRAFYPSERPIMADIILDGGSQALMSEYYAGKYKQSPFIEGTYEAEDFFPHMGENGRWLYFTACALTNAKGEVVGAIESLIDITERKEAEAEAQRLNSELNQVIAAYPQPILVLDKDHRITHWNHACEKVLGGKAEEMIGTDDQWKPFYPNKRPIMADMVMQNDGGESLIEDFYSGKYRKSPFISGAYECEDYFPNMGEDGEGRWLYFTASPLRNEKGEIIGSIESLIDITQRMQAESEVRTLNDELEERVQNRTHELKQANEDLHKAMNQLVTSEKLASLGNLVAGVAHELNTPIGNMLTVSSTLRDSAKDFEDAVKGGALKKSTLDNFLEITADSTSLMERSAHRAEELISNFKQVAVDQTSVRRREFDLRITIDEVLTTLGPTLKRTQCDIENLVPVNINLDSYPGPIEQVLTNLINNSLIHGFEGKDDGCISINATADEQFITLTYQDNGNGIPEKLMHKAFDPFFTTKLGSGGSGLGLYIIYNLITAVLGGDVKLTSEEGHGVKFVIKLPTIAPLSKTEKEASNEQ